ncbi:hypothetical protein [Anabaena subtropica]|uniref:Uncharacterized protein n=1 Tax=Anabaena subtropica FACHB-260 TaxID=2692884 RepID=A0ABR8CRV0_9NOST|nr:hypothetical protein [Anabaena subtropica]MBD2344907.1 hypothetical protein [Anabaena subtropica FACHB-260]
MPTKFLESLGGKLAENWAANILTPAFVFWMGGLLAWVWRFGRKPLEDWLKQQPESLLIAVTVTGLLVIAVSAFVVQRFDLSVLRFLEGYWSRWLQPFRRWMIQQQEQDFKRKDKRWQTLADEKDITNEELEEYVTLDGQLMQFPSQINRFMPTKLGNILRAAESRPYDKYGLDAVICWSRLWLILPDGVKKELQEARSSLNTAARFWLWSLLFIVWAVWAWWAVLAGLLGMAFAYNWAVDAAGVYCSLLESAFDLYRLELYKSLRWPIPINPKQERELGKQLTNYLWRGSDDDRPIFKPLQ